MWTDERVAALRRLWAEGLSASQIARELKGVTRNAVIGKVRRTGLAGRATPSRPAPNPNRIRPRVARPAVAPSPTFAKAPPIPLGDEFAAIAALPPADPALGVLDLANDTCRYPIGDPRAPGFAFCGRSCESTYCTAHAKLCYVPNGKPRGDGFARWISRMDSRGPIFMVNAA